MEPPEPGPASSLGGVVLAGGRAARFGGQDKGLILLKGQPLAAWVLRRLVHQVPTLVISANRHLREYAALGYPTVRDQIPGQAGLLAGVSAAARDLSCEWVLTVPCDIPFLPADLARRLWSRARRDRLDAVYACDAVRCHYSVMVFRRRLLDGLSVFLEGGGRRAQDWLAGQGAGTEVFLDDPHAFFNVNTPADLARAEALAPRYTAPRG